MQIISLKCPECDADLKVEEGRAYTFCGYCGTKISLQNENEHIYRHIDEAGVLRAETERYVQLQQLKLEEQKLELEKQKEMEQKKIKKIKIISIAILVGLGLLMIVICGLTAYEPIGVIGLSFLVTALFIGIISFNSKSDDSDDGKIKIPSSISDYEDKNYSVIESIFMQAGFTNIKSVPLNDLMIGFFKKPGMVESISVNGKEVTSGGKKFDPDAAIIITYHSMKD